MEGIVGCAAAGRKREGWMKVLRCAKAVGRVWLRGALGAAISLGASAAGAAQQAGASASAADATGNAVLQVPTTSSLFNPYYGSVQEQQARPEVIQLSLQDALAMGLANNLGLVYARQNEQQQRSQLLSVFNVLLPNIDVQGSEGVHQFNLQAEGFRPGLLASFASILGGGAASTTSFPFIVKVTETQGQANLSQYLFNLAGYDVVRAFQHAEKSAHFNSNSSRGLVVLNVGTAYLRAVAAQSQVENARALLKTDEAALYQAVEKHKAGISANIDELRARVQYQAQQQTVISQENNLAKARIALNREIGLAPDQQIALTETAPYANLSTMPIEDARRQALAARQDYQSLLEQLRTYEYERKAATHERYPTLIFKGNYGVTGVPGLLYHDTWAATGTLSIPIFQEAQFRSDRDTAEYQLQNVRSQIANLTGKIDQQLRDSFIDLRTAEEMVRVAGSNLDLAKTELKQSTERFQAGVDDNLPSIEAASTLAQAQTQYVTAVYQLNTARLGLARNLGLIGSADDPLFPGGQAARR
jgi:outer membrane protein TolC